MFSSTLSFLEKVKPSERFSPLENSLTPKALPGAALDYPLSAATGQAACPCNHSANGLPIALSGTADLAMCHE